ncbi:hypothetical protein SLT67_03640 [Paenibacillus illinoisensis]|uniref:hypothetical protein n=1 Tax=Paenibacillus illinoisensis TaxID=59845 RepID=UPI003CEB50B8
MKKILILGIVASGKTTLAKEISQKINIPWYELDTNVHHETPHGRNKRTPDEQIAVIQDIDRLGAWIFEGTDRASYRCLWDMADTIIFLDTPLWKRKTRIFLRFIKQNLGIEKSHYTSDVQMLKMMFKWTRDFERNRVEFENRLQPYHHKLIILTDNKKLELIHS